MGEEWHGVALFLSRLLDGDAEISTTRVDNPPNPLKKGIKLEHTGERATTRSNDSTRFFCQQQTTKPETQSATHLTSTIGKENICIRAWELNQTPVNYLHSILVGEP